MAPSFARIHYRNLLNLGIPAFEYDLTDLLEDANRVAVTRQASAHGGVPDEWKQVALPAREGTGVAEEDSARVGDESAVSPRTNPLKRM